MARKATGEHIERYVTYGSNRYRFTKSWHYLANGDEYHYIHVYKNKSWFPVKRFYWTKNAQGVKCHWNSPHAR